MSTRKIICSPSTVKKFWLCLQATFITWYKNMDIYLYYAIWKVTHRTAYTQLYSHPKIKLNSWKFEGTIFILCVIEFKTVNECWAWSVANSTAMASSYFNEVGLLSQNFTEYCCDPLESLQTLLTVTAYYMHIVLFNRSSQGLS